MTEPILSPTPRTSEEAAEAYRFVQRRVTELLREHGGDGETAVPACPEWNVRQALAHLCGAAEDVAALNLDGVGTDPWTAAQVDRHEGDSVEQLLDLWEEATGQVASLLPHAPAISANQLVFDAVTHEHDIRGALAVPGATSGDLPLLVALGFMTPSLDALIRTRSFPSLRLETDDGTWQLGDPSTAPSQLTLRVSPFDAVRMLGGRRSLGQLRAATWGGDPEPLFAMFDTSPVRPSGIDLSI